MFHRVGVMADLLADFDLRMCGGGGGGRGGHMDGWMDECMQLEFILFME